MTLPSRMMNSQTANKTDSELDSLLTDRKILLFRYDAHLRQKITRKLTALQRQLINRLAAAGMESLSPRELTALLKDIKAAIGEHYADIAAHSETELTALLSVETAATVAIYNDAVKFDLFNTVTEKRLNAARTAPIINGTPLKDWWAKQARDLTFKFTALIRQGLLDGKPTSALITEAKNIMGGSRRGAEMLVRTAVMKVHDKAQELVRDENRDMLKGEQHLSTLDMRTSEICRSRDGRAWDLDKKPIGDHTIPYSRPPCHPNCRSSLKLLTKSWRELGFDIDDLPESTRASLDGQVKENLTYEDWLKNKTPAQQDAVLGKGKAELWRNGVITFKDMLDQTGRPLSLQQLQLKYDPTYIVPEIDTKALKGVKFTAAKLRKKFKHADEFGIDTAKSNPRNWKAYQNAIVEHLNDENTREFGVYRLPNSKVLYNDKTGIALVVKENHEFLTVFKPKDNPEKGTYQLTNYLENGYLQ